VTTEKEHSQLRIVVSKAKFNEILGVLVITSAAFKVIVPNHIYIGIQYDIPESATPFGVPIVAGQQRFD
jgi:hypothetical protein